MATFAELSDRDRAQLISFMGIFRSTFTQSAQMMSKLHQLDRIWNASVKALVEGLDVGETVVDSPTAMGSGNLVREEIQTLMARAEDVLAGNDDDASRANYIKIGGILGVVG